MNRVQLRITKWLNLLESFSSFCALFPSFKLLAVSWIGIFFSFKGEELSSIWGFMYIPHNLLSHKTQWKNYFLKIKWIFLIKLLFEPFSAGMCYEPMHQVQCDHQEYRFYFDMGTHSCEGTMACPSPGNNFKTWEECKRNCGYYM